MNQSPERQDSAATTERRVLSVEEILELYSDYRVVRDFAGNALDDGAVKLEVDRTMLTHMKRGSSVMASFCVDAENELRYVVFVKERDMDIDNIIGGVAIGRQNPRRY